MVPKRRRASGAQSLSHAYTSVEPSPSRRLSAEENPDQRGEQQQHEGDDEPLRRARVHRHAAHLVPSLCPLLRGLPGTTALRAPSLPWAGLEREALPLEAGAVGLREPVLRRVPPHACLQRLWALARSGTRRGSCRAGA